MGIKICPECGGKVSETRNNCIHCGYIFPEPKPKKKCPDCEAEVDEDLNECPECGYYFVLPEASETKEKEPKTEESKVEEPEKQEADEKSNKTLNVVCSSCGSSDCEQLDEYTYRCRHCSSIIKVKKPDVNVYNINSFAGDARTADVPVYQVVKNFDEGDFVREVVLYLAKNGDVSPLFLEYFKVDKSMVSLAYLTFVTKEYQVDVSYSCEIGIDYTVKYYENGQEKTKKQTRWEPFSGTGSDGGTTTFYAFGEETTIDAYMPIFLESGYEFEEFKETDRYPLKRRSDRSCDEREKSFKVSSLESSCRRGLPGDHNRNFRSNGRCTLGEIIQYYYVPSFTLIAQSNAHDIIFTCVANHHGTIMHYFPEGAEIANQGDERMPTIYKAKLRFKGTSFGKVSLACVIAFPILMGLSFILTFAIHSGYFMIGFPIYLGCLIAVIVLRKKTINQILRHLIYKFKHKKLEACRKCLQSNNLSPLSDKEKEEIV